MKRSLILKKPEGVDGKSAYIIGSGLAALTAACYLVRDGQMKGEHIHIFEKDPVAGGACDGRKMDVGYVMRGGREMDNHFRGHVGFAARYPVPGDMRARACWTSITG